MIYLIVTIDTECDKKTDWSIRYPLQFESVVKGIPDFFTPIFEEYGIKPTYLLSPEVIKNDNCVRVLKDAKEKGAELGTHLHIEFVEPFEEINPKWTIKMQNLLSKKYEYEKLRNLTNLFKGRFGYNPTSFRAGRFGISKNTLPILYKLGYLVDSSVVPYHAWRDIGGYTEFWDCDSLPYFPSTNNQKVRGNLEILEMPVTVGRTLYSSISKTILRTIPKFPKAWALPRLFFKDSFRPVILRPTLKNGTINNLKKLVDEKIGNAKKQNDIFLNMMFHNVDFFPQMSPYCDSQDKHTYLKNTLTKILSYIKSIGSKSITLKESYNLFKENIDNLS